MAFKSGQATHAVDLLLCEGLTVQGDDTVCDCTLPIHLPGDCTENTPEQWHRCAWPSTQRQSFGFKCFARQSAQGSRFDPLQIDAGHARRRMIRPRQVICRRYQHPRWQIPIELLLAQMDYLGQSDILVCTWVPREGALYPQPFAQGFMPWTDVVMMAEIMME